MHYHAVTMDIVAQRAEVYGSADLRGPGPVPPGVRNPQPGAPEQPVPHVSRRRRVPRRRPEVRPLRVDRDRPAVPAGDRHGAAERGCPPWTGPRRVRAVLRGGVRSALMDLWLVRHGEAVPEREDPARPLSPEGGLAIRAVGGTLPGE